MIRRFLPVALFALTVFVALPGCKKKGCTDAVAKNFMTEAEKDDGSCEYYTDTEFLTMDTWFYSSVTTTDTNLAELQDWFVGFELTYHDDGTFDVKQPADTDNPTSSGTWEFHATGDAIVHDPGTDSVSYLNYTQLDIDNLDLIWTDTDSAGVETTTNVYLVH